MSEPVDLQELFAGLQPGEYARAETAAWGLLACLRKYGGVEGLADWEGWPNDLCIRAMVDALRAVDEEGDEAH